MMHPLAARSVLLVAALAAAAPCAIAPALAAAPEPVEQAKQRELEALRARIGQAQRRKASLEAERAALEREAEEVSARLVALAARMQAREAMIAGSERRIAELLRQEKALQQRLRKDRASTSELLAALQKLRRDPPPPFVTHPRDILQAVRGTLLLASAVPQVEARARRLRQRIARLARVRAALRREQEERRRNLALLRKNRAGMDELLARKRQLLEQTAGRLQQESRRLETLMRKARTINELIAALRREEAHRRQMELEERRRLEARRKAQEEARKEAQKTQQEAPEQGQEKERQKARRQPDGPPRPHLAFTRLKGRLPWPVLGERLLGFGEKTELAGHSQGVYVRTARRATVTAPADARVALARPFRSYGQLLILDVGQGYRILLAGLDRTAVLAGQFVRAGEPVGEMGSGPAPATVTDSRMESGRPILYMELRKKGRPVDPAPWWLGARQEAHRK